MSLQPRFEDVLHLVISNGYVEDSRQAVYVSKGIYTDDRVWFPFLIQHGHGPKKKTLPQIIAEHCTHVRSSQPLKIVPNKAGLIIYKPEKQWLRRMAELHQMAVDSYHRRIFDDVLRKPDTDGISALIVACNNNCPKIVSYLLKRGIDYNQGDNHGGTPQYYAYKSRFGRNAWSRLLHESNFKSIYEWPRLDVQPIQIYQLQDNLVHLILNEYPEPLPQPKKKLKRSEYKKQFGRR